MHLVIQGEVKEAMWTVAKTEQRDCFKESVISLWGGGVMPWQQFIFNNLSISPHCPVFSGINIIYNRRFSTLVSVLLTFHLFVWTSISCQSLWQVTDQCYLKLIQIMSFSACLFCICKHLCLQKYYAFSGGTINKP